MQDKAAAAADTAPAKSTGKLYLAPKSLQELFGLLEQYANQEGDFRVIAGNTGAGVYHDWPVERVLIDIKSIPELTKIEYIKVLCIASDASALMCTCCDVAVPWLCWAGLACAVL